MDVRDQILQFISTRGPVLPVQVAKQLNTSILIASAHLSELISANKLKLSNLKVGSSPVYFLQGQEIRLQSFIQDLVEKERQALELLRDKKILQDVHLDPAIRVAMKAIKDFAVPLQVNYQGKSEIFWKWYLLDDNEAEKSIKNILSPKQVVKDEIKPEVVENIVETIPIVEEIKKKEVTQQKITESVEKEVVNEKPKERIRKIKTVIKPSPLETKLIDKKPKMKKRGPKKIVKTGSLIKKIDLYFLKNKINVIEKIGDDGGEMIIEVPSTVGRLLYYCLAHNKKRISDGDLSTLYIKAQSKKLPGMIISSGVLSKKGKEMIENELKGLVVVNL